MCPWTLLELKKERSNCDRWNTYFELVTQSVWNHLGCQKTGIRKRSTTIHRRLYWFVLWGLPCEKNESTKKSGMGNFTAFMAFQVFNLRQKAYEKQKHRVPQDSLQQIHKYFTLLVSILLWTISTPASIPPKPSNSNLLRPGEELFPKSWVLLFLTKMTHAGSLFGAKGPFPLW